MDVFDQLFVRDELSFLNSMSRLRTVVDLGANVGYFSAYVLSRFQSVNVIAVEPDPQNAEVCRSNLKPYGERAVVREGAAWFERGRLVLSRGTFRDGREWASAVRNAEAGETCDIEAWDMPTLLQTCNAECVDLLKIDIEGSEAAVFSFGADKWLSSVRNLCIEIHDAKCLQAVQDALAGFQYDEGRSGEYTLFLNLRRH
jgi:FkbM family methyltransferase